MGWVMSAGRWEKGEEKGPSLGRYGGVSASRWSLGLRWKRQKDTRKTKVKMLVYLTVGLSGRRLHNKGLCGGRLCSRGLHDMGLCSMGLYDKWVEKQTLRIFKPRSKLIAKGSQHK